MTLPDYHAGLFDVLWLAWLVYWVAAAATAKPTSRRETVAQRLGHALPLLLAIFLLAMPWRLGALSRPLLRPGALTYWIGLALAVLGIGFACWARLHLGRNWSGDVQVKQGHELVRSGPYALVRHPIYSGLLLAVLGSALPRGTLAGALAFLLVLLSFIPKLRREERFMAAEFPDAYPAYRSQVRALVPFMI